MEFAGVNSWAVSAWVTMPGRQRQSHQNCCCSSSTEACSGGSITAKGLWVQIAVVMCDRSPCMSSPVAFSGSCAPDKRCRTSAVLAGSSGSGIKPNTVRSLPTAISPADVQCSDKGLEPSEDGNNANPCSKPQIFACQNAFDTMLSFLGVVARECIPLLRVGPPGGKSKALHPPAPSPKMGEGGPDSKSLSRSGRGI